MSMAGATQVLVGMDGIKQHHPGHLVRIEIGKDPDEEPPHGMTDEHVRRRDTGVQKDAAQPPRSTERPSLEQGPARSSRVRLDHRKRRD